MSQKILVFRCLLLCAFVLPFWSYAESRGINNFIIKEHLLKNGKLVIIVCDAEDQPIEDFKGSYDFSLNGFTESLNFQQGIATSKNSISKSTFLFIKHSNGEKSVSKLYYISKTNDGLNIIKINALYILLIPLILILFGMFFRKFLWLFILLLGVYLYLNYQNGLSLTSFVESIGQGVQDLISNTF